MECIMSMKVLTKLQVQARVCVSVTHLCGVAAFNIIYIIFCNALTSGMWPVDTMTETQSESLLKIKEQLINLMSWGLLLEKLTNRSVRIDIVHAEELTGKHICTQLIAEAKSIKTAVQAPRKG